MAEMKYIIWAICALTVVTGIVLVLRYRWFLKQISNEENGKTHKSLMSASPSYEKYKRIAYRKGVKCGVIRKNGDFADFLLSHKADAQAPNNLESQLASVDVGETL